MAALPDPMTFATMDAPALWSVSMILERLYAGPIGSPAEETALRAAGRAWLAAANAIGIVLHDDDDDDDRECVE